jgi:hypothetical protein
MVGEWVRIQLVASYVLSSVLSNQSLGFYFEPSFHITHGGWKATHFTKFSLISHINSGSKSNTWGLFFVSFSKDMECFAIKCEYICNNTTFRVFIVHEHGSERPKKTSYPHVFHGHHGSCEMLHLVLFCWHPHQFPITPMPPHLCLVVYQILWTL